MGIMIAKKILERANADGIEAARNLYQQMFESGSLEEYREDVNNCLLLEGREELIVKPY